MFVLCNGEQSVPMLSSKQIALVRWGEWDIWRVLGFSSWRLLSLQPESASTTPLSYMPTHSKIKIGRGGASLCSVPKYVQGRTAAMLGILSHTKLCSAFSMRRTCRWWLKTRGWQRVQISANVQSKIWGRWPVTHQDACLYNSPAWKLSPHGKAQVQRATYAQKRVSI